MWTAGLLANDVTLHRPTNDEFAYTQIDFHNTGDTIQVVPAVTHHEWPDSLISLAKIIIRAPGDTAALMRCEAGYGIGLWSDPAPGGVHSWVRYPVDPPQYATSFGMFVMGGQIFADGSGAYADGGKPIQQWKWTYEDGSSDSTEFLIGVHVRNWRTGQQFCVINHNYYTAAPTDPKVAKLLNGSPYFYDYQEIPLPSGKRDKRLKSIEVRARALPRDTCSYYLGTSGLFGLALWPQFSLPQSRRVTLTA